MYDRGYTVHARSVTNRRTFIGSAIALMAVARALPLAAQSPEASSAEGDADAVERLRAATEAVLALDTFTFSMETVAGKSTIMPSIELVSVEGVVRRPMDLTAKVTVKAFTQTVVVEAIALNGEFYVQNPLGGEWMSVGGGSEVANMINPDWIILAVLNVVKDATISSEKDGVTLIEGYVDFREQINDLGGSSQDIQQLEQYLASGPVDVAVWINQDNLIERIELYGPIFAAETPDVEKRIELSNFNEPVEIEAPVIN